MAPDRRIDWRSVAERLKGRLGAGLKWFQEHSERLEPWLYGVFAAWCALWAGHQFFSSMRFQLFLSESRNGFISAEQVWSAPLDDVFIHFDFARSAARGFPFQWSEGNGYSSGGTSLLYPLLLALGYRLGYLADDLMLWAGMVACVSIFYCLWKVRALASRLPRLCCWALPPALLCTGVLDWSLYSGMEVAFLLAVWAGCAALFWRLYQAPRGSELNAVALSLGLGCAVLTATRPETAVTVACFALVGLAPHVRSQRLSSLISALALIALPGALVVSGHAVANKLLTGDFSAAGALVKLEANDPYLTQEQVLDAWIFHFKYQILRVTQYHFSTRFFADIGTGWAAWLLAVLPLLDRRTRGSSVLLWLSTFSFMAVVALNGQVRWQNERYSMPAVAWLLLNAGLGVGLSIAYLRSGVRYAFRQVASPRKAASALVAGSLGLVLTALFVWGSSDAFAGQRWFFGRASRNIWDQHITVAHRIKHSRRAPSRVLVGDAGAIPYVADVPALDIIGLGGFKDLPFARATRFGVGAGIELIERIPALDRPDLMAIYPSWWAELPLWFGKEAWSVGVRGNVICGGAYKVVYEPDWSPIDGGHKPLLLSRRDDLRSELDVADVVSERDAAMRLVDVLGFVHMKMLPRLDDQRRDLWDAGRLLPQGGAIDFRVGNLLPHESAQLVLRVAPPEPAVIEAFVADESVGRLELKPSDQWQEPRIDLPAKLIDRDIPVRLVVREGTVTLYHVWSVQQQ